jgi:hypothetical protein
MNHHAEKPVEPITPDEERRASEGGIVIVEAHRCPRCGVEDARRVTLSYV